MMTTVVALVASLTLATDTTIVLSEVKRDLTGDGREETLRVIGVGQTTDSLDLTFTIAAGDSVLFRARLAPLTRRVGLDAGRRRLSAREHRDRLAEFGTWFFGAEKFASSRAFLDDLERSARARVAEIPRVIARDRLPTDVRAGTAIWEEIRSAPITVFTYSPGGDGLVAIGWSAHAGRFYRLLECC